jgi:hypothetical protein
MTLLGDVNVISNFDLRAMQTSFSLDSKRAPVEVWTATTHDVQPEKRALSSRNIFKWLRCSLLVADATQADIQ